MPTIKKAYCFTLNNYTEDEYESISRVANDESLYAIIGREVGASGTRHLQGYIMFKRPYRFDTVKGRHLPRCHIEVAAGSPDSNRKYCSKDGDYREFGAIPKGVEGRSTRDEIARVFVESMGSGRSGLDQFADGNPGTWYFSGHNLLRNYLSIRPLIERPNISAKWYWGSPGVGKSRRAHQELKEAYVKDPRTKWWSGYMLESSVIIDDFGPNGIDMNHLLRWFDRYKCYVESKGGMLPLYADTFIVTSNYPPSKCFCGLGGEDHPQLAALERRIEIVEM